MGCDLGLEGAAGIVGFVVDIMKFVAEERGLREVAIFEVGDGALTGGSESVVLEFEHWSLQLGIKDHSI